MATLSQKIHAHAEANLPLAQDRDVSLDLSPYRRFLKVETHRLKLLHRAGAGGLEICQGHAAIIDALLSNLWRRAKGSLSVQAQREFPAIALIATGGYGRGELNPKSDLDVMVLHEGQVVASSKPLPPLAKLIEFILMPLYDLNFKVGYAIRTIDDSVRLANEDMKTKTALIESRLIIGDERIFQRFQRAVINRCVDGHELAYIRARLDDQASRRVKFGNSPTMQEPNVKNGCGGLRDFHNLCWMAFFKHRTRSLQELRDKEFIAASEAKQLEQAYDFLLRARNELHYQTDRSVDVLSKSFQPAVAAKLGYSDRSPRLRLEKFMRTYYNHSRNLYLITRTVEERLALLPRPGPLPALRQFIGRPFRKRAEPPVDGFLFDNGKILPASHRVFRDQPRRLMRVFLHMQQRGLALHPDAAHLIRHQLSLVNRDFLRDAHVHKTFLEILNQRGSVAPILRAMHEVGFLGKYMPEFGRMTCLVQHEFYHQYTADEHTLRCLQFLDQIWESTDPKFARYAEVFRDIEQPYLLYLTLLLHDSGKAAPAGDHSKIGGKLAVQVARRLGLEDAAIASLRLLIENHLQLANISQRRDLDDPAIVRHVASLVHSRDNLRKLTLHTLADSMATSDKLWNGFKDSLLWELHHKTMAQLAGATEFVRAEALEREQLAEEVRRLKPDVESPEELAVHFHAMPWRYYRIHSAQEIADDISLAHQFMAQQLGLDAISALLPAFAWDNDPDRGGTRVKICTWDRAGLFCTISGALAACGINILNAQVFTREDDIVLDTFFVTDAYSGGPIDRESRERFESILRKALTKEHFDLDGQIGRLKPVRPLYQSLEGETIPLRIEFDNSSSQDRTVIEIESEDRVGLLYRVSKLLTDLQLDISLAKIVTEKGAAIDSFYVAELAGGKIESEERRREIEVTLRQGLASHAW